MSDTPPSSKPNYGSAIRVAQIIHWLHEFPYGISLQELRGRLGISERTLARYIQTLKESFYDDEGEALVEVAKGGSQGRLRFKRRGLDMEGTAYELMSLYMALDLMAFLEGTFIQEGAQEALDRLQNTLRKRHGHETALVLKDFHKKFFTWTEAPKDYSDQNEMLDQLVKALVMQRWIEIRYNRGSGAPDKTHCLKPLSMLMFKRGLYLVGRKPKNSEELTLTFAVERIKEVAILEESFAYPQDYEPESRFRNQFGMVQSGEPKRVLLHFHKQVAPNVGSRQWHHSQQVDTREDGSLNLTLELDLGEELLSWILGYGHYVTVMEPPELRAMVIDRLKQALDRYNVPTA
ncbi:MAG: WYL domain-containing protein [Acidobacteriota bacterium]|nr:WYL domain-containing protein [Acidobacteriota bacterium]